MGPGKDTIGLAAWHLVGARRNQETHQGLIRNRVQELIQGSLEHFLIFSDLLIFRIVFGIELKNNLALLI